MRSSIAGLALFFSFLGYLVGVIVLKLGREWPFGPGEGRCRKCRYDTRGLVRTSGAHRCPECGADLDEPHAFLTTRRRPRVMLVGGSIIAVSIVAFFFSTPWWSSWWTQHKPFSLVLAEVERGDTFDALNQRFFGDRPPDPEHVRRLLAVAMQPTDPKSGRLDGSWYDLLKRLHFHGLLSSKELADWMELPEPEVKLRAARVQGDELLFTVAIRIPPRIAPWPGKRTPRDGNMPLDYLGKVFLFLPDGTLQHWWYCSPGWGFEGECAFTMDKADLPRENTLDLIWMYGSSSDPLARFETTQSFELDPKIDAADAPVESDP